MKQRLARGFLRATGWRLRGEAPSRRCVLIAAPHTSNWDLLWMLTFGWAFGFSPRFMMKHTVFVGPAGWLFRKVGGIAIVRHRQGGMVKQMADAFEGAEELRLVVPPEGTRSRKPYWKSGFYHIAREAGVPVSLSFLDYGCREAGFGPEVTITGNVVEDMDLIRDFYADKVGRHPHLMGEIRLVEEELAARDVAPAAPEGDLLDAEGTSPAP